MGESTRTKECLEQLIRVEALPTAAGTLILESADHAEGPWVQLGSALAAVPRTVTLVRLPPSSCGGERQVHRYMRHRVCDGDPAGWRVAFLDRPAPQGR